MANSASWNRNIVNGKKTEEFMKEILENRGHKVWDVSEDPSYQAVDVDFVLEKEGVAAWLDVKYSRLIHEGRFLFGAYRHRTWTDSNGWMYNCKANYIAFACHLTKHHYVIKWGADTIKLIEEEGRKFQIHKDIGTDDVYEVYLSFFEKHNLIVLDWREEN